MLAQHVTDKDLTEPVRFQRANSNSLTFSGRRI